MAITQSYVDYNAGSDATGDGTIGTPWRTLQWAFDHLVRNTTDGNQVNLKAGTAQVNAAALDLATFIGGGALAEAAPLIVRGYTATTNDGGIGEIDCGGATMWAATTYDYVFLVDLEMHTFGDNHGVQLDSYCMLYRCEVHKGASSPTDKYLVAVSSSSVVQGCYVHDLGDGTGRGINATNGAVAFNYVVCGADLDAGYGIYTAGPCIGNIVLCAGTSQTGIYWTGAHGNVCINNVAYNSTAGTTRGIYLVGAGRATMTSNNIVVGWSGAGGDGVEGNANAGIVGYNALYACTANTTVSDMKFIDLTASDVALAADPFTDAANGDFSLTTAGKAALRGLGWPAAYLGAHASTDGHVTIGAVQYGESEGGGGGAVSISPLKGNIG